VDFSGEPLRIGTLWARVQIDAMSEGTDIHGNPIGTDIHGNATDKNGQGARPKDIFGNPPKDFYGNETGTVPKPEDKPA
jgi:hypothetical protein